MKSDLTQIRDVISSVPSLSFRACREIYLLNLRHELLHRLPNSVHRRGLAILRGIPHIDDGDEIVAIGTGKDGFQQGGIEGTDPERGEPLILRGQHEVRGDDGGIDLGPILPVIPPHPSIGGTTPDGEKQRSAVVGSSCPLDGLQCLRVGDGPYVNGLLVDGRGGDSTGGEDAVDEVLGDGLRGEGAAGVTAEEEGGKVHDY